MPTINKKSLRYWARKPEQKEAKRIWSENVDFYNAMAWRNCRMAYMNSNPLCEVSMYIKKYVEAKELDHIIPIRFGGAPYDSKNLMGLSAFYHKRKTGLEVVRKAPLVEYIQGEHGLIPKNRSDIIKLLIR